MPAAHGLAHHEYVDRLRRSEGLESEKILMDQTFLTLTRIFKEGSASARRPAVTQAAAPPSPIVNTTAAQIEK